VARPYLYTTSFEVISDSVTTDSLNVTTGVRTVGFSAKDGFLLNGKRTKMRGFCDHSNFGGVGAAVPDRVNLFRIQALRSVGSNTCTIHSTLNPSPHLTHTSPYMMHSNVTGLWAVTRGVWRIIRLYPHGWTLWTVLVRGLQVQKITSNSIHCVTCSDLLLR
jgi:hypothetical protein